jgi:hypothetical protein
MKETIEITMLPTEDELKFGNLCTSIRPNYSNKPLIYGEFENSYKDECKRQYVYITNSQGREPIKSGDYVIDGLGELFGPYEKGDTIDVNGIKGRKIISTNDHKLLKEHDDSVAFPKMRNTGIAQVSQSFLKEFVANPDGEYEVEYEVYCPHPLDTYKCGMEVGCDGDGCNSGKYQLKLNQDNEVNITSVEEKMYTKEQFICKLYEYWGSIHGKNHANHHLLEFLEENL